MQASLHKIFAADQPTCLPDVAANSTAHPAELWAKVVITYLGVSVQYSCLCLSAW